MTDGSGSGCKFEISRDFPKFRTCLSLTRWPQLTNNGFILYLNYLKRDKKRRETNSEYLAFTIIYLPRTDRILQLKQQEYTIPITGRKHLELGERGQVEQNLVSHSLKNYLFRCGLSGSGGLVERLVYIWDNWVASIKSKKVKGDQFTRESQHQVNKLSSVLFWFFKSHRSLNSFGDPSEHCLVQLCTLSCSCAF